MALLSVTVVWPTCVRVYIFRRDSTVRDLLSRTGPVLLFHQHDMVTDMSLLLVQLPTRTLVARDWCPRTASARFAVYAAQFRLAANIFAATIKKTAK